jgi:hypothetical protein
MTQQEEETFLRFHYASEIAVLDTTRASEKNGLVSRLPEGVPNVREGKVDGEVQAWTVEVPLEYFGHAYHAAQDPENAIEIARKRGEFSGYSADHSHIVTPGKSAHNGE